MKLNTELKLPGWKVEIDFSKLEVYNVEFKQVRASNYLLDLFNRGEFKAQYPFGLFYEDNKVYYFKSEENTLNKEFLLINRDFGIIKSKCKKKIPISAIPLLIHTKISQLLENQGYIKPFNIRGCLGKYSKGILSNHNKKKILSKESTGLKIDYYICPAEKFDYAVLNKSEILISYLPKYEIFDEGLSLPQDPFTQVRLQETDIWNDEVFLTPQRFLDRYNKISEILLEKFDDNAFKNLTELNKYKSTFIPHPQTISINNNISKIDKNEIFSTKVQEKLRSLKINLKIDIFVENSIKENKSIKNFLESFKQRGFETEAFHFYQRNSIFNNIFLENQNNKVFIIDSDLSGNDYFYNLIKSRAKKNNKMIQSSSIIEEKGNWEEIIDSVILSLFSRNNYKSLFEIPYYIFNQIYSLYYMRDFDFRLNFLFLGNLDFKSLKYAFQYRILPWENNYKNIGEKLINELKPNSCIIFEKNNIPKNLYSYLLEKISNCTIITIDRFNGRIFEIKEKKCKIPYNGSYIKIADGKYLLITTGKPEYLNIKRGLPNPLLIEIINNESLEEIDILKTIYYRSFINLETSQKNLYPYILHQLKKISYNYNIKNQRVKIKEGLIKI